MKRFHLMHLPRYSTACWFVTVGGRVVAASPWGDLASVTDDRKRTAERSMDAELAKPVDVEAMR